MFVSSPLEQFEIVVAPFSGLQFFFVLFVFYIFIRPRAAYFLKRWGLDFGHVRGDASVSRLFYYFFLRQGRRNPAVIFVTCVIAVIFAFFAYVSFFGFWQKNSVFFSNIGLSAVFLVGVIAVLVSELGRRGNALVPAPFAVFVAQLLCFAHNLVVDHVPNHPKVRLVGVTPSAALFWPAQPHAWELRPSFTWNAKVYSGSALQSPFYGFSDSCWHYRPLPFMFFLRRLQRRFFTLRARFLDLLDSHPSYFVTTLFVFVLFSNLLGMVPYSFAITSQLVVTFTLSFVTFVGLNIFAVRDHGWHFLDLFLPTGVPLFLAPFVILIEVISYIARVFSLGIRLFANIMAGHTLLKILGGFITGALVAVAQANPFWLPFFVLPLLLFAIVTLLEFAIAFLQAYVFTVLVCLYINDVYSIGSH